MQYLAHDDKFQQNFQVPFMVLSSDDKAHKVIKAQRSANDFLSFFSQWTGIQAAEITHAIGLSLSKGRSGVHHQLPAAEGGLRSPRYR